MFLEIQAPYSTLILSGTKTIETRRYPFPSQFIGKPIFLLETPQGTVGISSLGNTINLSVTRGASVVGTFVVSRSFEYESQEQWDKDSDKHCVSKEFLFSKPLYGWVLQSPLEDPLELPEDIRLVRLHRSFFTIALVVPTVNVSTLSENVLQVVKTQCQHVGFLRVSISTGAETVRNAHQAVKEFFALPDSEKQKASKKQIKKENDSFCSTGYRGPENGANNTGGRESWSCVRPEYQGNRVEEYYVSTLGRKKFSVAPDPQVPWPQSPPQFRASVEEYYQLMQHVSTTLFRLFATSLDLPNQDSLLDLARRHTSSLMLSNHRPGHEGEVALVPHADITCFTILSHDDSEDASGTDCLQVANPYYEKDPRLGVWIQLAQREKKKEDVGEEGGACFLVNIGQIMERWSNGALKATLHRVVRNNGASLFGIKPAAPIHVRRQALVYFQNTDYNVELAPLVEVGTERPRFPNKEIMMEYEEKRMRGLYDGSDRLFETYNQDVLYRVGYLSGLDGLA
ncbi:UNVERIFIED_CONTAM: hypothetical protein HDU68_005463, partial [Siphonaria sp. JEL0065]